MRKTSIIALMLITTLSFSGCSKPEIEKKPVVITDEESQKINEVLSLTEVTKDSNMATTEAPVTDNMDNQEDPSASSVSTKDTTALTEEEENSKKAAENSEDTKTMTIEIEGMKEEINGKTHQSQMGYQIVYDYDRFELTSSDQVDSFMAENPEPDLYPYVYLNISRYDNTSVDKDLEELKKNLTSGWIKEQDGSVSGYIAVEELGEVTIGDYKAAHYAAKSGSQWNSPIRNYYLLETEDCLFLFETQYFLEAAEGYGARIQAMLDTFIITELGC